MRKTKHSTRRFALGALLCVAFLPALAQTPQEKARIDFETAKKALALGDASAALRRFESVLATLGSFPEIELWAAKAAVALKDFPTAKKHIKEAFASADAQFKQSPEYQSLVSLAADVDLALEKQQRADGEARLAGQFLALKQRLLSSLEARTGIGGMLLQHPEYILPMRAFDVSGVNDGDKWVTMDRKKLIEFWLLDWGLVTPKDQAGQGKIYAYWFALAFHDPLYTSWSPTWLWEGEVVFRVQELAAVPTSDRDYLSLLGESVTSTWIAINDHGGSTYRLSMTPALNSGWHAKWVGVAPERCSCSGTTLEPGDIAVFKDGDRLIDIYHKGRWDSGYELIRLEDWERKPCALRSLKVEGVDELLCASGLATGLGKRILECSADPLPEPKP